MDEALKKCLIQMFNLETFLLYIILNFTLINCYDNDVALFDTSFYRQFSKRNDKR